MKNLENGEYTPGVTKSHIVASHAALLRRLAGKAASVTVEADCCANRGETNQAVSYLLELQPLLKDISALNDATLAIHGGSVDTVSTVAESERAGE